MKTLVSAHAKTLVSAHAKTLVSAHAKTLVSKQAKKLFAFLVLVAVAAPAWAATQTVTLAVPDMTCPACPFTVKKALTQVDGVQKVEVSYKKRQAIVTFDDAKANVQALTRATTNAGYPSTEVH